LKRIYFTVTNDLTYDQRMHRICTSLAQKGYAVTLIGRKLTSSLPLEKKIYTQKRFRLFFNSGKLFYAEYNFRLFFYLLFKKMDAICAIDLDTIIPCYYVSKFKNITRIYDAHELFTEQKEIISRPRIYKWWKKIEQRYVPLYKNGYTVSQSIATFFKKEYGVQYELIRNMPLVDADVHEQKVNEKFILYQGAVNEARGLEALIPAMKNITLPLVICGDGNFMPQLKKLIAANQVADKVTLKGMVTPNELRQLSKQAFIGINLVEKNGLNQYFSLANKFFDYIHAAVPQITMNFPEYKKINDQEAVALLIDETTSEKISTAVNNLAQDVVLYNKLKENCVRQRLVLNWQQEEIKLVSFYYRLFN
jgi:glycosyltransferase involved in cell wall biosynthesis